MYRHKRHSTQSVFKHFNVHRGVPPFQIGSRNFKNRHLDLLDISRRVVKETRKLIYWRPRQNVFGLIKFRVALLLHNRRKPFWIPGDLPMLASHSAVNDSRGLKLKELAFKSKASPRELRQYNNFTARYIHRTIMDFVEAELAGENPHYVSVGSSQYVFNQNVGVKAKYRGKGKDRVRLPLKFKQMDGEENTWDKFQYTRFKVVRFDFQVVEMVFRKVEVREDGREEEVY